MDKFTPIADTAVVSMDARSAGLSVELRSTAEPSLTCPYCGSERVRNGTRRMSFRDVPHEGQLTIIEWRRQKFICPRCRRSSHDAHPAFDERHAVTKRFVNWVSDQGRKVTFASLSKLSGVDEKVVRRIFADANKTNDNVTLESGLLGIELMRVAGSLYPAIIDIQERAIVDVFSSEGALRDSLAPASDDLALARIIGKPLHSAMTLVRDIELSVETQNLLIPTHKDVISRPSLHRFAVATIEAEIKPLFEQLRTEERPSTAADLALFRKRESGLGPTAQNRLKGWQGRCPRLRDVYCLKEDFLNAWRFDANPAEVDWQMWTRRAANLGLDLSAFIKRIDSNKEAIAAYSAHRALHHLYPSLLAKAANVDKAATHSFAASRAILLDRMGRKN
jgi:hypothetical protein